MKGVRNGDEALDEAENAVVIWVDGFVAAEHHLDAGDDKNGSEDKNHPLKVEERRADCDEDGAEEKRAEDAVKKNAVLELLRYAEVPEDDDEDEHVVDAERFFEHVAGEEFKRYLARGL